MLKKITLKEKFNLFKDHWSPKIIGALNDSYVKIAKFEGDFVWHQHEEEDELFLVIAGELLIKLRDQEIHLTAGELVIIPKGVEHMPAAEKEAQVLLIELKSTVNTGDQDSALTVNKLPWV